MKNLIVTLCLLSASVPLLAEAEGTSPLMMLSRVDERPSIHETRDVSVERTKEGADSSATQHSRSFGASEERMQQSLDLQLLTSIAKKMEARMQQVLNAMSTKPGKGDDLTSLSQRGVMSLEEESLLKTITENVTDQTMNLMTEEQINSALMQEQERTLNALEAYYQLERNHDETSSEKATEPLEDYEQIKENLTSAIRHAFITMQRAYCAGTVLPQVVESVWRRYQAREPISGSMVPSFMPPHAHEEAINDAQLRSAARVAHRTDREVHEGLVQRGYIPRRSLGDDIPELAPTDALDQRVDEQMRTIGSIHGLDKTRTQKETAWERYQQMMSRSVASARRASSLPAPAAPSEEQDVHRNLINKIADNEVNKNSQIVSDRVKKEKQEALERYQAMMHKK